MGNKKNIDRLFQEGFNSFEVAPDDKVWRNIESMLDEKKESKKNIPIWMRYAGIAALLLLFIGGVGVVLLNGQNTGAIVNTPENEHRILDKEEGNSVKEGTHEVLVYDKGDKSAVIQSNKENLLKDDVVVRVKTETDLLGEENKLNDFKSSTDEGESELFVGNSSVTVNVSSVTVNSENQKLRELLLKNKSDLKGVKSVTNSKLHKSLIVKEDAFVLNKNITEEKEVDQVVENRVVHDDKVNTKRNDNVIVGDSEEVVDKELGFQKRKEKKLLGKIGNEDNKLSVVLGENVVDKNKVLVDNQKYTNSEKQVIVRVDSIGLVSGDDVTLSAKLTDDALKNSEDNKEVIGDVAGKELVENPVEKTIEEAIAELEELKEEEEEEEENVAFDKWKISPRIAPVFYNTLSTGSPIDNELSNNKKKGQLTMSYGLGVGYVINNRLTVRAGINNVELGYDTQDVAIYSSPETSDSGPRLKNINFEPGASSLNLVSSDGFSISQIPSSFSLLFDSSLNQRLGYLEVPLELSYKVSDKKMKIDLIAGVSTFFLNKNEIYTEVDEKLRYIGEANNLNKVSYSTNIGFGFNYKISNAFNFNFEPMFKYQLNAFSKDSGNFRPYILGVYSGFSFKF